MTELVSVQGIAASPTSQPSYTEMIRVPGSPIEDIIKACVRIATSDATVLLTGETGTGKEVFARLIHDRSRRNDHSLVPVNCGAIPEALLESELFGHVKGAFTGAIGPRKGRIAAADGGTLFLDEVGELPLSLQVKLLRVLQERSYEPVGATEAVSANFRLVAATNRDLAAEVEAGRFRRDLYYRLLVCPLELPPLRARRNDIRALFQHFWDKRGEVRKVDEAVIRALEAYPWPGNVREMENLVERISVVSESPVIGLSDLPTHMRSGMTVVTPSEAPLSAAPPAERPAVTPVPELEISSPIAIPLPELLAPASAPPARGEIHLPIHLPAVLRDIEDAYIDAALARSGGSKKGAADLLGLQRTTLVEKLRRRNRDAPSIA